MLEESLQKAVVIAAMGLQDLRDGQDDGGHNPQRLRTVSAKDMAQPRNRRSQVLIENKHSEPRQGLSLIHI